MVFDIYNPHDNQSVTKDYVATIEKALRELGHEVYHVDTLSKCKTKNRGAVVILPGGVRKAKRAGYKYIIDWIQGVSAEESFMRNHSYLRYYVIRAMERYALKNASFILFVSDAMKKHYEKIFHRSFDNSYIMPCFNEEMCKDSFNVEDKYSRNTFIYAGSISNWQCFEPMIELYRKIEERVPNSTLRLLVKDADEARRVLKKYGVERYSIDFVPKEEVANETKKAKFGFCLRENSIINNVATPTKLSSYICHGVMPIYSSSVQDFHERAKNSAYCFCINPENYSQADIDGIVQISVDHINCEKVFADFTEHFENYYSVEYHISMMKEAIKNFLK